MNVGVKENVVTGKGGLDPHTWLTIFEMFALSLTRQSPHADFHDADRGKCFSRDLEVCYRCLSKMREVKELSVAAGERVLMEPGGYHLMQMMPASDVLAGQVVPIEMTTTDGRHFQFELPVERR